MDIAFENIDIPILVIDRDMKNIRNVNRKAISVFGKISQVDELFEILDAAKRSRFNSLLKKTFDSGKEKKISIASPKKEWNVKLFPFSSGITVFFELISRSAIAEKAKLYQTIADSMGDIFLLTDENFRIIDCNTAMCKKMGLSKTDLLKHKTLDFIKSLSPQKAREYQSLAKKAPIMLDIRSQNADGTFTDLEINYFSLQSEGKSLFGSIARDVTILKNAQRELERSNQRFEMIAEATQEGLWELNLVTNEKWANEVHQEYYGLTTKDPIPSAATWEACIHPADRNRVVKGQDKAIARKKNKFITEYWFNTKSGEYIYLYDRTLLFYDDNGKLIKMMGSMVDITELKNAQEELNIQKNISEGVINSLPGVFYLLSKEGRLLRWNKNFEKITGYSPDEIKNSKADTYFVKDDSNGLWKKITEVFQKGKAEMEASLVNKEGVGTPYYLTGWRTVIGNEECLIGAGIDISEMKKAQENIKRMEQKITEQRIQEQKVISRAIINAQEKERNYIGRELHDNVNQLLAGARLYLSMGGKKSSEFRQMINYPLELLDSGIQEIRHLTHKYASPPRDTDLRQLMEGTIDMLKTGNIQCSFSYGLNKTINVNLLTNVYRILQEQVNNIIKHSHAKRVSIKIYEEDDYLFIKTRDDGVGFDVHKFREGIGLYNIYSRVEAYNGEVEIESEPGKGCSIDISIPFYTEFYENELHENNKLEN